MSATKLSQLFTERLGSILVRNSVPAATVTTFAVGGVISTLVEPTNIDELSELLRLLRNVGVNYKILGAGSNLVIREGAFDHVVIRLSRSFSKISFHFDEVSISDLNARCVSDEREVAPELKAGAAIGVLALGATPLMSLSRKLTELGITGLEFAAGIPASVGGAVRMNAGAHQEELASVVRAVFIVDEDGNLQKLPRTGLDFSYRKSNIGSSAVVVGVELALVQGDSQLTRAKRTTCLQNRSETQPLHLPSAGSVFVNPDSLTQKDSPAAGWLLEQVGLKGVERGGVRYSELHANWLVKVSDRATAADVIALIDEGKERVGTRFGIELRPEIIIW